MVAKCFHLVFSWHLGHFPSVINYLLSHVQITFCRKFKARIWQIKYNLNNLLFCGFYIYCHPIIVNFSSTPLPPGASEILHNHFGNYGSNSCRKQRRMLIWMITMSLLFLFYNDFCRCNQNIRYRTCLAFVSLTFNYS